MRKLVTGSGVLKGLTGLVTTTKGAVVAAVVTSVVIAAGFGFWYVRDATPTIWMARSAPTATALSASIPTLALAATPPPAPTAIPRPTATPRPAAQQAPPIVLAPQLSVNTWDIMETTCRGAFSPYGITLKNTGGGTVTWQASSDLYDLHHVQLNTWSGRLAAGQSQQVTMSWYSSYSGAGPIPPAGSLMVTFTSNGGEQQVRVNCPPS